MKAVLFDLDGVLYEGSEAVPGAARTVAWVREQGLPHLFLTNTTSRPRHALVEKLAGFGIPADAGQILTPPVAAVRWLKTRVSGPIALFVPDRTLAEFGDLEIAPADAHQVAAVVVGDLGDGWDFATLNRAFRLLMAQERPPLVALGMTRYWRAPDGLRLDAGAFVTALTYAAGVEPVVTGKPAPAFFQAALALTGTAAAETVMIGDDLRSDIEGAQQAGLRGVLVRTGKFRTRDLEQAVQADAVLESVAALPGWWTAAGNGSPQ
ncbi:MAG TPA: TIGR01458 family HAD-type hydrolase [Gammaproteobacteria bacterium]|nr:TIGR01458 family HAD-type hydrolase [Gammaproteobacteria bacterium]